MKICAKKIKLKAYAKLNLSLYINGVREDGYHLLDSVFVPVGLFDTVTLERASGIKLTCGSDIPHDYRNTAYKAAALMLDKYAINGAEIAIEKNIPHMAGLGGASADAAAVILGLNELYGLKLTDDELSLIGLKIGADVPFFLGGGAAQVQGIGEIMTSVAVNAVLNLVIIKPECSLSTPEVYNKYDEMGTVGGGSSQSLLEALEEGDVSKICGALHNDLQSAAVNYCPQIEGELSYLTKSGAMAAKMTGSGSCVYGIFETREKAEAAARSYDGSGKVYVCQTCTKPVVKIS